MQAADITIAAKDWAMRGAKPEGRKLAMMVSGDPPWTEVCSVRARDARDRPFFIWPTTDHIGENPSDDVGYRPFGRLGIRVGGGMMEPQAEVTRRTAPSDVVVDASPLRSIDMQTLSPQQIHEPSGGIAWSAPALAAIADTSAFGPLVASFGFGWAIGSWIYARYSE